MHKKHKTSTRGRITVSKDVLIAARRRGISTTILADIFNVSHQAIQQKTGNIKTRAKRQITVRRSKCCAECGKTAWVTPGHKNAYCSIECWGLAQRKTTKKDIEWAIEKRLEGWPWYRIAKSLSRPVQVLQKLIWIDMFHSRRLTEPVIKDIWYATRGSQKMAPAWNWLMKSTGVMPTVDGGIQLDIIRYSRLRRKQQSADKGPDNGPDYGRQMPAPAARSVSKRQASSTN